MSAAELDTYRRRHHATYDAVIGKAIPGGTGGFELSIGGCSEERGRVINIAKVADEKIVALTTETRLLRVDIERLSGISAAVDEVVEKLRLGVGEFRSEACSIFLALLQMHGLATDTKEAPRA